MANNLQLLQHRQNAVWNNLLKVSHEAMLSNLLQHIQKAALNNLQLLLPPRKAQLSDPGHRQCCTAWPRIQGAPGEHRLSLGVSDAH